MQMQNFAPLMFASLVFVMLIGFPVAFSLSALGLICGFIAIEMNWFPANFTSFSKDHWSKKRAGFAMCEFLTAYCVKTTERLLGPCPTGIKVPFLHSLWKEMFG